MENLPSYYSFEPYYQSLLRQEIRNNIAQNNFEKLFSPNQYLESINHAGYEVSEDEYRKMNELLSQIFELTFLEKIIKDHNFNEIEEVILHSHDWIQLIGSERREFYGPFLKKEDFQLALELLSIRRGILWNQSTPFESFQIPLFHQTWRAGLLHHSLCGEGNSKLFLRSQQEKSFKLADFSLTEGQEILLETCVRQKKNIIICGATGSGKTSFLSSLLTHVPEREHLIILEDTSEISAITPFTTKLISKPEKGKLLNDYCYYALRMRPDRIILGEIRGNEVVPFLLSINTGHGGMMASLHSNSAIDAIHRLCLLFQIYSKQTSVEYPEVLKLVCQGIDFIVHLENKKVTSILEVKGSEGMTPYYELYH